MMRREFTELTGRPEVSTADWDIINKVYVFHPCISKTQGKAQIAALYSDFGMRIIRDMLPTADKAEELQVALFHAKGEVKKIENMMEELGMCSWLTS